MEADLYLAQAAGLILVTLCLVGMGIVAVYDFVAGWWTDRRAWEECGRIWRTNMFNGFDRNGLLVGTGRYNYRTSKWDVRLLRSPEYVPVISEQDSRYVLRNHGAVRIVELAERE